MAVTIDSTECIGCETCVDTCPSEAISMVDGIAQVNEGECIDCGMCVDACATEAISL